MQDWGRWCRCALVVAGGVALLAGGVSIFGQPDREVLYAADPRNDLPSDLERTVAAAIADCDPLVVAGWLDRAEVLRSD